MAIIIPTPEEKICGEEPCWQPEGYFKTNGRCAFTGCQLPFMWQCRRVENMSVAEEEAQARRYPNEVHAIVIDKDGNKTRYNTLAEVSRAFDVNINYVRYYRNRGTITKGGMEGYKILV